MLLVKADCPRICQCKWRDGKETVSCANAGFIDIPRGLDRSTQVLDLQYNNLRILPPDAFVDAGLVNVQKVWLTHCKLKHLHRGAFRLLANLIELDLSNNLLIEVPANALADATGLRELHLNHNYISSLPESIFTYTSNLVRLDISYNNISEIHDMAFMSLTRLEVLKITGNLLTTLTANILLPLVALHGFHIGGNPWHCDCLLRPLRKWMLKKNGAASISPMCESPGRLKDRRWHGLGLDEFVCVPELGIMPNETYAKVGDNVTLSCRVKTDADAAVTWYLEGQRVPNITHPEGNRHHNTEQISSDRVFMIYNLTILDVTLDDEGEYRCVAENKAGMDELDITLLISENPIFEVSFIKSNHIIISSAILGIFICLSIVLSSITLCYYKRKRRHRHQRARSKAKEQAQKKTLNLNSTEPKIGVIRNIREIHSPPSSDLDKKNEQPWVLKSPNQSEICEIYTGRNLPQANNSIKPAVSYEANKPTISCVEIPNPVVPQSPKEDPLMKNLAYQCQEAVLKKVPIETVSPVDPPMAPTENNYPDLLVMGKANQNTQNQEIGTTISSNKQKPQVPVRTTSCR